MATDYTNRQKVGYRTPEQGRATRMEREAKVFKLLEENRMIDSAMVVELGFDISVARGLLNDMTKNGSIKMHVSEKGTQNRKHWFTSIGLNPMRMRWVTTDNGVPLGQWHRKTM